MKRMATETQCAAAAEQRREFAYTLRRIANILSPPLGGDEFDDHEPDRYTFLDAQLLKEIVTYLEEMDTEGYVLLQRLQRNRKAGNPIRTSSST
jgi:hypothetical protein